MIKKISYTVIAACLASTALANNTQQYDLIQAYNNQASLSIDNLYVNYNEYDSDEVLDSVKGSAPGITFNFRKTFGDVFIQPTLSFYSGDMEYDGGSCDGVTCTPFSSDTPNFILKPEITLGYIFNPSPRTAIAPIVVYGYQRWDREVPPIAQSSYDFNQNSYTEEYTHSYLAAGLEIQQAIQDRFLLVATAWFGRTLNPQLYSNTPIGIAGIGTVGLTDDLGKKPIFEIKMHGSYFATKNINLFLELSYLQFSYGESAPDPTFGFYEPDSTTKQFFTKLGVAYSFA